MLNKLSQRVAAAGALGEVDSQTSDSKSWLEVNEEAKEQGEYRCVSLCVLGYLTEHYNYE